MSNANGRNIRQAPRSAALLALGLAMLAGCGRPDKLCPVAGTVLVNNRPAGGVYVVFQRIDEGERQPAEAARTLDDGSFALRVREPGRYAVTAFWPTETIDGDSIVEGPDRFGGRLSPASDAADDRDPDRDGQSAPAP